MKANIKILVLVLSVCFFAGCICTGCSGREEAKQKDETALDSTQPVTLIYGYIDADPVTDLDNEIKKQIAKFNRSQEQYILEIKKYGNADYAEGLAALNSDITAGKGPDIIQIDFDSQYREYASKGMLEDLYPYLDAEEQLCREDLFENVLNHFVYQDSLCGLSPFFSIYSMIGNPNYLSDAQITFEDFCRLMESNSSEETEVCQPLSRESVLSFGCDFEMNSFVDLENHTCNFTNDEFIHLLTVSAQFPSRMEQMSGMCELYGKWQQNQLYMMYDEPIFNIDSYTKYKSLLGKDALLIGWPSMEGCSPQVSFSFPYITISSVSKEKAGAWEFVRSFLQKDFLLAKDNDRKGFPILKEAFDLQAQEAMEIKWGTDEEGNPVEIPEQSSCTDLDGTEISWPVYAATEEEIAYLRDVIDHLEPLPDYGEIVSMIYEEASHYWSGNKTAQEVASVIQNRVQLYLEERR